MSSKPAQVITQQVKNQLGLQSKTLSKKKKKHLAEWALTQPESDPFFHNIWATIALVRVSYQTGYCCSSQGSHLDKTGDY